MQAPCRIVPTVMAVGEAAGEEAGEGVAVAVAVLGEAAEVASRGGGIPSGGLNV